MNQRQVLICVAVFGTLAVGLGAFGAHSLRSLLEATGRRETFELAVRYHFLHTLALFGVGILIEKFKGLGVSAIFFVLGILVFSGSLYTLALTNTSWWGAVTPFGGLCLLGGWIMLGWSVYRNRRSG